MHNILSFSFSVLCKGLNPKELNNALGIVDVSYMAALEYMLLILLKNRILSLLEICNNSV